jgi:DNA invertase Pin-like site-specific DNA recombinase
MSQCANAYYRVSTRRQGRSGLGIEAQRARVEHFADAEGFKLIGEHVDTGKGSDALDRRPHLAQALSAARQASCVGAAPWAVYQACLDRFPIALMLIRPR